MARNQLSDEMKKYGYIFSIKKTLLYFVVMAVGMWGVGLYFQLQWTYIVLLCAFAVLLLPFFLRNAWKNRYEQQRFSDVNIYIEQFLYSFQKSGKVLTTIEDVESIFEDGKMKRTIGQVREHILHTYNETQVELEGLRILEEEYPCEQLHTLHGFALQVERHGGEYHNGIALLLEARRYWADRVYMLLKEKKRQRMNIVFSIAASLLLCSIVYLVSAKMHLSISAYPICQLITSLVLALDLVIAYKADRKLSTGYFEQRELADQDVLRQYRRYLSYDERKPIQKIGKRAAKKGIAREMEKEFPRWLMQVSLLLQTENVQVAVMKSYADAPRILQKEIKEMVYKLQKEPESIRPYMEFLQDFTLPEVRSSMKMLYSISEGKGGQAQEQITDIIRRNQVLLNKTQVIKNEDALAGMYGLFLAPQITGGIKLMGDLVFVLMAYIGQMGV